MKAIKKTDLNLSKEVVSSLSENELSAMQGGNFTAVDRQITDLVGCPPPMTVRICQVTQQNISECMITCTGCPPPFTTRC